MRIEIAYRVLDENPGKRVFLLSEMIHNPQVNEDLRSHGVHFLMKTDGSRLIDFKTLTPDDIVIVPAFGTTVELQKELQEIGVDPYRYDATCPFVEKVWKRADELGRKGFSVVVHGKRTHEETRATFSHSQQNAPTLVVLDIDEARSVIEFMKGKSSLEQFHTQFSHAFSNGFDPAQHLNRIGVVNQTTMLASETKAIAEAFKAAMIEIHGPDNLAEHYADTRDTLCYATYENQGATRKLREAKSDLAIVVGGYNSSNTSHLVELCQEKMPTYYIKDSSELESKEVITHFSLDKKACIKTKSWLPLEKSVIRIAVTAGASCPDSEVDAVIAKICSFFDDVRPTEEALKNLVEASATLG